MDLVYRKGYINTLAASFLSKHCSFEYVDSLCQDDYDDRINMYITDGNSCYGEGQTPVIFLGQIPEVRTLARIMKYGLNGSVLQNSYVARSDIKTKHITTTKSMIPYIFGSKANGTTPPKSLISHIQWIASIEAKGYCPYRMTVENYDPSIDEPDHIIKRILQSNETKSFSFDAYSNGKTTLLPIGYEDSFYDVISYYSNRHPEMIIFKEKCAMLYSKHGINKTCLFRKIKEHKGFVGYQTSKNTAMFENKDMSFINNFLEGGNFELIT